MASTSLCPWSSVEIDLSKSVLTLTEKQWLGNMKFEKVLSGQELHVKYHLKKNTLWFYVRFYANSREFHCGTGRPKRIDGIAWQELVEIMTQYYHDIDRGDMTPIIEDNFVNSMKRRYGDEYETTIEQPRRKKITRRTIYRYFELLNSHIKA